MDGIANWLSRVAMRPSVHCAVVYVFLGDHHALIDLVRYMQAIQLDNGDYLVISVHESPYDRRQRYFNKCML